MYDSRLNTFHSQIEKRHKIGTKVVRAYRFNKMEAILLKCVFISFVPAELTVR